MSTRRKHTGKGQPARPNRNPPKTGSLAAPPWQQSSKLLGAQKALEACVGGNCLVEVTLHSLGFQEIATPEQEVLKRALKAIWCVHDWIDELRLDDVIEGRADQGDES